VDHEVRSPWEESTCNGAHETHTGELEHAFNHACALVSTDMHALACTHAHTHTHLLGSRRLTISQFTLVSGSRSCTAASLRQMSQSKSPSATASICTTGDGGACLWLSSYRACLRLWSPGLGPATCQNVLQGF